MGLAASGYVRRSECPYVRGIRLHLRGLRFSIRHAEEIVGLMGLIDLREHDELEEGDDPNAAFLMRMMIGSEHQGQGFGTSAMHHAISWARARGNSAFQTSVVPGNHAALRFYVSLGLNRTGRVVEDEIELTMGL
ncbi:GNAT family N-acetyltransferase [Histidinibacterium aquaticum]|uniref:GNAT family N-acetyltransferase n=1 Tax=Histidinibacterium aquaticum TaxID=2613962 RepID=A0A5J5GBX8_9RHOB|nr:GNAT family N-acetyltransferase [Histidinibacterium aquaticum]KAA9005656.1 GNAT family N-acetyltransferase [Histidinibacterium aquaticum]